MTAFELLERRCDRLEEQRDDLLEDREEVLKTLEDCLSVVEYVVNGNPISNRVGVEALVDRANQVIAKSRGEQ